MRECPQGRQKNKPEKNFQEPKLAGDKDDCYDEIFHKHNDCDKCIKNKF